LIRFAWEVEKVQSFANLKTTYGRNGMCVYKGTFKLFRTGAVIYTAAVVAQSTGRWQDYHV
jgi:hypothetical protein